MSLLKVKSNKDSIKKGCHFFLIFLLMFDFKIPGMPNGVGTSLILLLFFFLLLIVRNETKRLLSVCKIFSPIIYLHILVLLYTFSRVFFGGGEDLSILLAASKSIVLFSAVFLYWSLFEYPDDHAAELVINTFFVNSIICFVAGSIPAVLDVLRIFQNTMLTEADFIPYRNAFLSGSGFFSIGSAYGLAFLFCMYVYIARDKRFQKFRAIQLIFIAVAGFIAARTSLFAIFTGLFILFLFNKSSFFKICIVIFIISLVFLLTSSLHVYNDWLFEFFDAGLESKTATGLINDMYFLPPIDTLIFGDGFHNVGGFFYGGSDVGYIRNILFGGVPYLIIIVMFPVLLLRRIAVVNRIFSLAVFVVILTFHGKGAFIYNNAQGMAVFYMMYAYFSQLNNKTRAVNRARYMQEKNSHVVSTL